MALNRKTLGEPKKWEILGAIFGYFATAKDIPSVFKTLNVSKLLPLSCKLKLLSLNSNPDFWYLSTFTIALIILLLYLFWPTKKSDEPMDSNSDDEHLKFYTRHITISYVRSLGLIFIRNKMLDLFNVGIYGTFRRHADWEPRPNYFSFIDRITFKDGSGPEFQYAKNFQRISIRTHTTESDTYGPPEERKPTWKEMRLLLFASNFFPFWAIPHLLIRIFVK